MDTRSSLQAAHLPDRDFRDQVAALSVVRPLRAGVCPPVRAAFYVGAAAGVGWLLLKAERRRAVGAPKRPVSRISARPVSSTTSATRPRARSSPSRPRSSGDGSLARTSKSGRSRYRTTTCGSSVWRSARARARTWRERQRRHPLERRRQASKGAKGAEGGGLKRRESQ